MVQHRGVQLPLVPAAISSPRKHHAQSLGEHTERQYARAHAEKYQVFLQGGLVGPLVLQALALRPLSRYQGPTPTKVITIPRRREMKEHTLRNILRYVGIDVPAVLVRLRGHRSSLTSFKQLTLSLALLPPGGAMWNLRRGFRHLEDVLLCAGHVVCVCKRMELSHGG